MVQRLVTHNLLAVARRAVMSASSQYPQESEKRADERDRGCEAWWYGGGGRWKRTENVCLVHDRELERERVVNEGEKGDKDTVSKRSEENNIHPPSPPPPMVNLAG